MKKLVLFILFSIIALSLTTCKKYPQDDKLSRYPANDRLTTTWILTKCIIDGEMLQIKHLTTAVIVTH